MVSKLKPTFVTDEFIGAVADSLATGNAITLTTAVASATTYTDAQLSGLNYAGSQSATKNLTTNLNSAVVKADTNTIVIDVDLVNQNLNSDFQISTVLINATYKGSNILVGVVRFSAPELFPAYDNISIYELEMKLYISVSRIADAKINVNSAGMATAKSVQDLRTYVDGDFNADIARKTKDNIFTGTNTFNKKIIAPAGVQGNADTATKLQTARRINGTAFDGTTDILLDPTTRIINSPTNLFNLNNGFYYNAGLTNTNVPSDATAYYTVEVIQTSSNGYMVLVDSNNQAYWNTKTANAWQQWKKISDDAKAVHNSGDEVIFGKKTFSNGIIASLTGNADTASKLQTPRTIGGVPFDGGSNIDLPGVNKSGNQDTSGRAANATNADHANNSSNADLATKATALQTPRKINGTAFDGTSDINVNAANDNNLVHTTGDESMSGTKTFSGAIVANSPIKGVFDYPFPTDNDLNNLTKMGQYKIGYNYQNTPTGMPGSAFIFVYNFDGNLIYQTIFARQITDTYNKVTMWTRMKISGDWGAWQSIAKDDDILHLSGDETAAGFKKFSGNIATTSDNSMINGGGNNGDIALVKKSGTSGALVVGQQNSFSVKQSANASILPTDTQTMIFNVNASGRVVAGTQQDLVPLDKNVVHNSGNETIAGAKAFTDRAVFDKAIYGKFESRILPDGTDLYTLIENNVFYLVPTYAKSQTIVNKPSEVKTAFGILAADVGGYQPNSYAATSLLLFEYGSGKMFIASLQANGSGVITVAKQWTKIATDESLLVHNTGNEDIYGDKTFKNKVIPAAIELFSTTPYIDFHFNNDTGDYTSRIIETAKGTLSINGVNISGSTISGTLNGNASSATKLQTPRNINGVGFDGNSDIRVDPVTQVIGVATDLFALSNGFYYIASATRSTNMPDGAGTYFTVEVIQNATNGYMRLVDYQGNSFWITKDRSKWTTWHQDADDSTVVHNSGNETIGGSKTFSSTINGNLNGNSTTATKLQTARKIGGVYFDGSTDINLPGVNTTGNQNTTGNAATATKLQFARRINGVSFDGSNDISVNAANDSNLVHKDNTETLSGNKTFSGVATFAKAQTSSTIKKTITTSAPIALNFSETAFGVMVYASASGTFTVDSNWKTLATLPTEISAPVQIVTLNDVDWGGVGGVTNRFGIGLKIAIKPNREITYKVTSLKENDNTTYNVGTTFDASTYWSK